MDKTNKKAALFAVVIIITFAMGFFIINNDDNTKSVDAGTQHEEILERFSKIVFRDELPKGATKEESIEVFVFMKAGSQLFPVNVSPSEVRSIKAEDIFGPTGDLTGAVLYPIFNLPDGGFSWRFRDVWPDGSHSDRSFFYACKDEYSVMSYSILAEDGMFDYMKNQADNLIPENDLDIDPDGVSVFVRQNGLAFQAL